MSQNYAAMPDPYYKTTSFANKYITVPVVLFVLFLLCNVILWALTATTDNFVCMVTSIVLVWVFFIFEFGVIIYLHPYTEMLESVQDFLISHPDKDITSVAEVINDTRAEELVASDLYQLGTLNRY